MTKIIGAPTLDDAAAALTGQVKEFEERGQNTIIFCEDRLTLVAERAVLAAVGGTFRTEVTTFARFLAGNEKVLSKEGSVIKIESLLSSLGGLSCFRKGGAAAVYETVAQLAASRVDGEMLRRGAGQTEGILRNKLLDLALITEAYQDFLRESGYLDESGYLALLPEKIAAGVKGKNALFFAFPSFTKQAEEGVRAAIAAADQTAGIFLSGRAPVYTNAAAHKFRCIAEECGEAVSALRRSSLEGDAERIRTGMFSPASFEKPRVKAEGVHLFYAADEAEEISRYAALIRKYTAEGKRYREIALLVPDEGYFLTVEKVFSAYHIPFFADRKKPFSEHPFLRFAAALLNAVNDGILPDEADEIASSVYFGEADEYRNYLLRYGAHRGGAVKKIKEGDALKGYNRELLLSCRDRMEELVGLFPRAGSGHAYVQGLQTLYEKVEAARVTEELAARLPAPEGKFLDLTRLAGILSETEAVAGERRFTAREFAALLTSGASALKVSMIPQYADAVFVGDITESRLPRVPVLLAAGLTDALPRVSADTAVINDRELKKLETLRVEIEPAIEEVNARARESLTLNLSSFTEALYASCPARVGGEEKARGEVMAYLEEMFNPLPMPALFPYDCSEREPAALALFSMMDSFSREKGENNERHAALRAALERRGEGEFLSLVSGGKENVKESAELIFSADLSPTLLESYFSCPYAGFAMRGLRLREREEMSAFAADGGTFVHAVLEKTAALFNGFASEEECRACAREIGAELLSTYRYSALADTDAGRYTGSRLIREGEEVSAAAYRQLAGSAFRVRTAEEKLSLSALKLAGRADRVDAAGDYVRIIDYKTGSIDDKPLSYYTGRKLQLQLYLRAAAENGRAAGAFYFPAATSFTPPDEPKYRMKGFFCGDDEVVSLMDVSLKEGEKSAFFEGGLRVRATDRAMKAEDFGDFLDYALLVSKQAEREMEAGNIAPSPYEGACEYCKLKGMCGFVGDPRKERSASCTDIVRVVRREREGSV